MVAELDIPFWIKGRQANVEPAAQGTWRITGPNLPEAIIGVRMLDDLTWQAYLRDTSDGPDLTISGQSLPNAREAIAMAFELYREKVIY